MTFSKRFFCCSLLFSGFILGNSSQAADIVGSGSGLIKSMGLTTLSSGTYMQISMEIKQNQPACATWQNSFVTLIGTPEGKSFYATALAAKIAGKPLGIQGTGLCPDGTKSEQIRSMSITD